tara:strand:- start:289 stop:801 length:513 start_codon:yes stop_codon:yes gene_type:complete
MATAFNRNEIIAYEKGYRITRDGKLINPKGDVIKGYKKESEYRYYKIRKEGDWSKYHEFKLSRLQAFQKFGYKIYEKGTVVRHLNNDKGDDSWHNIEIGTQSQNCMDNPEEDRKKRGYDASRKIVKHSDETVIKIRADYASGMSYRQIGKKYNISSGGSLHHIIHKRIIK